jgi:hypothetical protein
MSLYTNLIPLVALLFIVVCCYVHQHQRESARRENRIRGRFYLVCRIILLLICERAALFVSLNE